MTKNIIEPGFASLVLETMADGVFTLDSEGVITSWNPAMAKISGYGPDEALGKKCSLMNFNRCIAQSCPTSLGECGIYTKTKVDGKECFLRHKEGHDVPVVKSARLVKDEAGRVKGVVETVTDLTELKRTRQRAEEANRLLGRVHKFDNIIGKSHAMQLVFSAIKAASSSQATVLLQGESGTGKELVARSIHFNSARAEMPLVIVNCSALSESLLESELFGHVKGAFTSAGRDRVGRFEEANTGTVFLDEIGDITPFIQVKLLRVLQEREIERVGDSKRRKIDIRIITATNRDLYALIQEGKFREDLYYRLKVFPINLPPLRKRKKDMPLLLSHFIENQNKKTGKKIKGISQSAMRILMDYTWPGNVRELENAVEHAFVLCEGSTIDIFDLPVEIRQMEYHPFVSEQPGLCINHSAMRGKGLTREILVKVLHESDWNKAEVGRRVGLSRTAIWKYMKKWDIPLKKQ